MCGIVGYIGKDKCIPRIIGGLEKLEYRGYDSSGIAYIENNKIVIKKAEGKIANLKDIVDDSKESYVGIGHTRWATHGKPSDINSHPHHQGKITIVHNGIIENYKELKNSLKKYKFISETDTEVLAALIDELYKDKKDMLEVLKELPKHVIGSYALGILVDGDDKLYTIRKDSPLIIGISSRGNYIASDVPAILEYTNKYYLLNNCDYAVLDSKNVTIYSNGKEEKKELLTFDGDATSAMLNNYPHFMLKEIYEQPIVVMDTINEYINDFDKLKKTFRFIDNYKSIDIVACGSSYHVGLLGRSLLTKYGDINVNVDIASEYRYTKHVYNKKHLIILISQSGETADSLAVLREAKENGIDTLAIVNVFKSSIAREADRVIYTKAGPEISVATTKAYSCQFMILSLMALYLGIKNKYLDKSVLEEYKKLEKYINTELRKVDRIKDIANMIYDKKNIFYLGRKEDYAIAQEASLKLKEVSYLHSEAYAAGELKHGTISLIDKDTPVISIITCDDIRLKTLSNVKEICTREGISIVISNEDIKDKSLYQKLILIPKTIDLLEPLLVIVNCQLLAYYVGILNGCDIDKPKNLAKSVTVE